MLLGMINTTYMIIILLLALLIFGGKKLPELGRSLGKGITEFKKGLAGIEDDFNQPGHAPAATQVVQNEAPRPPQPLPRAPEFHDAPKAS